MRLATVTAVLALLAACGGGSEADKGNAPSASGGVIQVKGSDTMVNLMQAASEAYTKVDPNTVVAVTGGGSGTGIKSLIDKTTDVAAASREMKPEEIEAARKNGVEPKETTVAYDGLAVYVNKENPVATLSFEDLKCIYGDGGTCNHWKDVGVTIDCGNGDDTILKVGRQNNSGTYEYFREEIIGKDGKFTNTMDQSGTQQVVDVVGTSKCAIGYGGMGYHTEQARFVCLSKEKGGQCSEPTIETVMAGAYPFGRPLHVYTNGEPQGATKAFIDWFLSDAGQKIVVDTGFVPLPKAGVAGAATTAPTGAEGEAAPTPPPGTTPEGAAPATPDGAAAPAPAPNP
jgi:phosphate transport system substrate-binding protein